MAPTEAALEFQMTSPTRQAVLTVTRSRSWKGQLGWKAVIRVDGEDDRRFGSWRPNIVETVRALLHSLRPRISSVEQNRLLTDSQNMEKRRKSQALSQVASPSGPTADTPSTQGCKSQALSQVVSPAPSPVASPSGSTADTPGTPGRQSQALSQVCSPAPSQGVHVGNSVKIVHQIYGLFGDGKSMSPLFESCQQKWQGLAESMGANYHVWSADDLEALVKQMYPQYWDMYTQVRYPVMRCDIGRLIVLHAYGGLYADLDTEPNRPFYLQVELALPRIKLTGKHTPKRGLAAKKKQAAEEKTYLDMEVIIASRRNSLLIRWLDYIKEEIANKPYRDGGFWHIAKMRYIYHTTGPKCMNRFLRLPCNANWLAAKRLHYLECNHFKDASQLTALDKRRFDVISHESNSYFTQETEIHVPVGAGDKPIPKILVYKRLQAKLAPSQEKSRPCDDLAKKARSQEDVSILSPHQEVALCPGGAASDPQLQELQSPNQEAELSPGGAASDPILQELQSQNQRLKEDLGDALKLIRRTKKYIDENRNCVSAKVFLESMPENLAFYYLAD
jgi:hypothetical protein